MRVLFVCLGNICRSPLAEGLFIRAVREAGLQDQYHVDSAGTGAYPGGDLPDPRARRNAASHNLELVSRSRPFMRADFDAFDHILVMDRQNEQAVLSKARHTADEAKVRLMRDYDPDPGDGQVPDPWYGDEAGYEDVYQILHRCIGRLLSALEEQRQP